jgi:hypothetical protein
MKAHANIQTEFFQHEAFARSIASFLSKNPNEVDDLTLDELRDTLDFLAED